MTADAARARRGFVCAGSYVELSLAMSARCGWKRSCPVCRWRGLKWATTISRDLAAAGVAILTPRQVREVHREHEKRRSWKR